MKNMDEKILDIINREEDKKDKKQIIDDNVNIDHRYYQFKEKKFFDDKVKMYIPEDFKDMPLEFKKIKYPSENRPEIIKSNEDGSIAITLNVIESPLDEESVEKLKDEMKNIIKKTNPANVFFQDGVLVVDSKNIGYFEFKSSTIDDFLYNLMFFFEFEGKTLMGTFSCLYKTYKEWRDIVFQMLNTIKVIK